jgi:hypothetical protein
MDNTKANSSSFDEQELRERVSLELSKLEELSNEIEQNLQHAPQPRNPLGNLIWQIMISAPTSNSNMMDMHINRAIISRAIESLKKGDMAELNSVLDLDEIKEEARKSIEMTIEKYVRLSLRILLIKAKAIILDDTISLDERTEQACDVYRNVIEMAKEISNKEGIPTIGMGGNYRKRIVWDNKKLAKEISNKVGNEASLYLDMNLPTLAEIISRNVFEIGEEMIWTNINIASACIMQDKFEEADESIDIIKYDRRWVKGLLEDWNKFEEMGLFTDEQKEYINKKREELK